MKQHDLEQGLMEYLEHLTIIDCHEHMFPESERLAANVDAVTFFSHYNRFDLVIAGMKPPTEPFAPVIPTDLSCQERWALVKPFLPFIRHTTYAKAAFMSLTKFYGFDDFNDATIGPITDVAAAVLYLASPAGGMLNGSVLLVDGGWTAQ